MTQRTSELEGLLGELGIGRPGWSTSGVSVTEHREWQDNRQVPRGYRATSATLVRLADPETIGRLLAEAVRRTGAAVLGPRWIIDADNPAHLDADRLAAGTPAAGPRPMRRRSDSGWARSSHWRSRVSASSAPSASYGPVAARSETMRGCR